MGPKSVWDALSILHSKRIGHGVQAVDDMDLVRYLAEHEIPLEVSVTSNLCTGIYPSYEKHPIRKLLKHGVKITINTDDPTFFHTTLTDEYMHLYKLGIAKETIISLIENGFKYAFTDQKAYIQQVQKEAKNYL